MGLVSLTRTSNYSSQRYVPARSYRVETYVGCPASSDIGRPEARESIPARKRNAGVEEVGLGDRVIFGDKGEADRQPGRLPYTEGD